MIKCVVCGKKFIGCDGKEDTCNNCLTKMVKEEKVRELAQEYEGDLNG